MLSKIEQMEYRTLNERYWALSTMEYHTGMAQILPRLHELERKADAQPGMA